MIPVRRHLYAAAAALMLGTALAGCASHEPLTSYYVLTSDASGDVRSGTQAGIHGTRIFIRRVEIPGYLQTTKFTSRHADDQVEYSTTALWAEPLDQGIANAVGSAMNRTSRVTAVGVVGGGVPPARDYDLKIAVERFEGDDKGEVALVATWSLFAPESSTPLMTRRSRFVQTGWKYGDEPGLAKLMAQDLSELGSEIARSCPR
jgi:uncharacterized lipoprotein YmbA